MKFITILLLTIFTMASAGLPPTVLKGEAQSASPTTFNFITPNNQSTQISGVRSRIETGNKNLLANPSFEHSTFNTGWTTTLGTATLTTNGINAGSVVDGLQAYKITSTGAAVSVSQTSTINAAALKGQQLVARVKVYSTDPALQVCPIVDSVDTNCTTIPVTDSNTPFKAIEIPFIGGGTNNGIRIKSATTTTQTIYIDDASVGTSSPFQNVSGAQLLGTVTIAGCASVWSTTSTSYVSFPVQTGCVYTTSGQALAPSTMVPGIKFASMPAGDYRLEVEGAALQQVTAGKVSYARFSDGVNIAREESQTYSGGGGIIVPSLSQSISYASAQSNVTLDLRVKTDSGGTVSSYGTTASPLVIKVWYFPPDSKVYSQKCDDPSKCETNFSFAVSSTGVVSNENTNWISGNCTVSAYVISCVPVTGMFTVIPNCTATIDQDAAFVSFRTNVSTATNLAFRANDNTGSVISRDMRIQCQKQGVDYDNSKTQDIRGRFADMLTSVTCPTGYVLVPGNTTYFTKQFCVAKYEMKNDGYGTAASTAAGAPWVNIDRPTSRSACQALGQGFDMISNDQWQTIARNIAGVASNWSTGTVTSGELNRGHSDNVPTNALVAVTDDNDPCYGTGQSCTASIWNSQRRTYALSNGNKIWDLGGNVWEWITNNNTVANGADGYISTMSGADIRQTRYGASAFCATPGASPYCGMGYGLFNYSAGAVIRGGTWSYGVAAGVFAAYLSYAPTVTSTGIGFRCVFVP